MLCVFEFRREKCGIPTCHSYAYARSRGFQAAAAGSCTWVPRPKDDHPPRTPLGPWVQAYGRVLGGCVFL